jgi:hypothetical protein
VILVVHIHHVREQQIASRGVRHEGPDLIDALLYVEFAAGVRPASWIGSPGSASAT